MRKYTIIAGLVISIATIFSGLINSHYMLNQPKSPSMLVK